MASKADVHAIRQSFEDEGERDFWTEVFLDALSAIPYELDDLRAVEAASRKAGAVADVLLLERRARLTPASSSHSQVVALADRLAEIMAPSLVAERQAAAVERAADAIVEATRRPHPSAAEIRIALDRWVGAEAEKDGVDGG